MAENAALLPPEAPLFDADNHYYEPRDCFTRHIEPRFRDRAIHVKPGPSGREETWIGEKPFTFLVNRELDRAMKAITGFARRTLAKRVKLRHTPELRFLLDDSIAEGSRTLGLIRELDLPPEPAEGVPEPRPLDPERGPLDGEDGETQSEA